MNAQNLANTNLWQYTKLLIDLKFAHLRKDEEEADRIRLVAEDVGHKFNYDQIHWLQGLSGDLDIILEDEVFLRPTMSAEECTRRLADAIKSENGTEALLLARQASHIAKHFRAYIRARAYDMLGFTNVAVVFMRYAYQTSKRYRYACLALEMLVRLGQWKEALSFADEVLHSENPEQSLVMYATGTMVSASRYLDETTRQERFNLAITLLEPLILSRKIVPISDPEFNMREYEYACVILAFCYEKVKRPNEALQVFDILFNFRTNNADYLVGRGNILIDLNRTDEAIHDYLRAVELHTRYSSAYLILAREALSSGEFKRCRMYVNMMLNDSNVQLNSKARATAYDFLAICAFQEGDTATEVQRLFDLALAQDPDNPRIRRNRETVLNCMLEGIIGTEVLPHFDDLRGEDLPTILDGIKGGLNRINSEITRPIENEPISSLLSK